MLDPSLAGKPVGKPLLTLQSLFPRTTTNTCNLRKYLYNLRLTHQLGTVVPISYVIRLAAEVLAGHLQLRGSQERRWQDESCV
jgi:hypothetical protein